MKKIFFVLAVSALCAAPTAPAQDAATEERLNKLTGQIEDLQAARVKLDKQMSELLKELSSIREQIGKPTGDYASSSDVQKLAGKIQEIDQKRIADYDKIVKEVEKIVKASASSGSKKTTVKAPPAPSEGSTASGGPEKGFKYVIQSGDTLSTIAQAYREQGVKIYPEQILKANEGLNANKLRVGQEIWIPKPQ